MSFFFFDLQARKGGCRWLGNADAQGYFKLKSHINNVRFKFEVANDLARGELALGFSSNEELTITKVENLIFSDEISWMKIHDPASY